MRLNKRSTIYDIAKKLNITPSTVSRALNNDVRVKEATKKRVHATAKELNYKPNTQASALRTGGYRTIGLIVPQITINFFAKIIAGVEEVARSKGYNTIICQSDDDFEKEKTAVETLINQNVACIIISLAAGYKNANHLLEAINHNIHVIQFDRIDENLSTHKVTNKIGVIINEMMSHLTAQGYKKIAFMAGPQNIDLFKKRKEAFEKSLKKLKLFASKKYIDFYNLDRESAKEVAKKLLTQKNRPDAIFASSDLGALGAWEVAKELGIKCPEELGICGFSNEFYTEIVNPSITTIDQFSFKMGQASAELFFSSINSPELKKNPDTTFIEHELIFRDSTQKQKK